MGGGLQGFVFADREPAVVAGQGHACVEPEGEVLVDFGGGKFVDGGGNGLVLGGLPERFGLFGGDEPAYAGGGDEAGDDVVGLGGPPRGHLESLGANDLFDGAEGVADGGGAQIGIGVEAGVVVDDAWFGAVVADEGEEVGREADAVARDQSLGGVGEGEAQIVYVDNGGVAGEIYHRFALVDQVGDDLGEGGRNPNIARAAHARLADDEGDEVEDGDDSQHNGSYDSE